MKNIKFIVKTKSKSYPIYFGNGIVNVTGKLVQKNLPNVKKLFIICDRNIPSNLVRKLKKSLKKYKLQIYKLSAKDAMEKIKKIILGLPRTKLIKETDQFLHIEFKTAILRFIDDVEIVINDAEKVIHLRSASRLGYWDLGANRRRIEKIKKKVKKYL